MDIHLFYLTSIVLLWIIVYHAAYWLIAITRDPSLICWSVGPFGFSVVSLREPPLFRVLAQVVLSGIALASIAYVSLFVLEPPPIAGLVRTAQGEAIAVGIPLGVFTTLRLLAILRDRRFPLWGEARVLASVQRSVVTGARVYFTPAGRAFLQERFGATPHEFLQMVRY